MKNDNPSSPAHPPGEPLVSFVVLAYRQEEFVREAIEGAFSQTYGPLEIILSDDCSPDATFEIMKEMARSYRGAHKIVLNRNEKNLGLGAHVQRVADISNGEYMVMAGGDDVSLPERTSASMQVVFEHGELGGVFGRYHEFTEVFRDAGNWKPYHAVDGKVVKGDPSNWILRSKKGQVIGTPGATGMWNRKLFMEFPPIPEGAQIEDLLLGYRALMCGLGVGYTSKGVVQYRVHGNNVSAGVERSTFARRTFFSKAIIWRDLEHLRRKNPNLYAEAEWDRITRTVETMVFRTIVISCTKSHGPIKTPLLLQLGQKQG